jgi:DnaJ-class molecular chaperone
MIQNYYRVLGLADNAEDVVIRAAYKLLAHRHHPDKCLGNPKKANQLMAQLNESYNTLSDTALKAAYDNKRASYTATDNSDYYQILGILNYTDTSMIQAAYAALCKKYERLPDTTLSKDKLSKIRQAHQVLSDPAKRRAYDIKQNIAYYLYQTSEGSSLNLWKVYLIYNILFYILIALIYLLIAPR